MKPSTGTSVGWSPDAAAFYPAPRSWPNARNQLHEEGATRLDGMGSGAVESEPFAS
jgi:hypothetical protein